MSLNMQENRVVLEKSRGEAVEIEREDEDGENEENGDEGIAGVEESGLHAEQKK